MNGFIVPLADGFWQEFTDFYRIRAELGDPQPFPTPGDGLGFATDNPQGGLSLVAGVMLYPTRGPFLVVEHFATHPALFQPLRGVSRIRRARLVHHAAYKLLQAATICAASRRQQPLILVRHPSIRAFLRRAGYTQQPAGHWTVNPIIPAAPLAPNPRVRKEVPMAPAASKGAPSGKARRRA